MKEPRHVRAQGAPVTPETERIGARYGDNVAVYDVLEAAVREAKDKGSAFDIEAFVREFERTHGDMSPVEKAGIVDALEALYDDLDDDLAEDDLAEKAAAAYLQKRRQRRQRR